MVEAGGGGGSAGRGAAVAAAAAAVALLLALSPEWLHGLLACSHRYPLPEGERADVAVVLGYALHRNGTCTRPLQSRVEVGVDLFLQGAAAHLIFSGAHPGGGLRNATSEANAMAAYAEALLPGGGPRPDSWLLEERSTSTRTNAVYSLDMVQRQRERGGSGGGGEDDEGAASSSGGAVVSGSGQPSGSSGGGGGGSGAAAGAPWRSLVVVTNPFHQLRSYLTFRRALEERGLLVAPGAPRGADGGVALYVAAAPFAPHRGYGPLLDPLADRLDFWRELAAFAWYWARGYI